MANLAAAPQEIGLKLRLSPEGATHDVHDTRFQRLFYVAI